MVKIPRVITEEQRAENKEKAVTALSYLGEVYTDVRDFREDCERIVSVLDEAGYEVSVVEAAMFWKYHSALSDASWLILHDHDEVIVRAFEEFLVD